ncbi:ABC transporter-like protein [Mycolicibacterium phlei]|uniref:ABC transporter n=1 Tax=Mycolicibacterium phlei DSM 43239 = CCUG 21000 TaxID=1226750 RepID=A0A5N5VAI4_MYCPH|nr:ATP-binding cassette domain-containing protein [Mycolicibacterium phlei]VEG07452.1 ABC transporter-like protein [Mycobacteroides chelonae]AMO59320.1 putative ABC transporter ATP-binding protein [Mycolicibacterium phlei]KAB7758952.1 ABC transporter [Mycolicibacterium phlei DSM 43239 = CCUG 21000]KXW59836.1 ABC transporter [Mycolicibacterium phlei DSM 43072]KXW67434.1 ABC transporter [Mycolicibacterium phlei DSM 43239 = CCUG 21000]
MSETDVPALSFEDVAAARGGRLIWSEATFTVPAGGIVAVIGSNGAGKTTLLQIMLGLIPPAAGHVKVFGEPPGALNKAIGYVPQNYAAGVGEAVRARDAVMLGLTGHRWGFGRPSRQDNERVDAALAAVDATGFANKRLSQLSGGQRQRVALAEALVARPRMLILDEPLAALDIRSQREIVDVLERVNSTFGVTIFVVAHDLNPLLGVLTSAIYLLDGHAHFDTLDGVVDEELLSHLYGTRVEVVHTPQGDLYMRRT